MKEIYESPIFLSGISAGACHGTRLVAHYEKILPIECYVSISNPYNFARLSYTISQNMLGYFISKFLAHGARNLYSFHAKKDYFKKRLA